MLYVPTESVDAYKSADQWKDFNNIEPDPTKVNDISIIEENSLKFYFDFNGRETPTLQKGMNIVKKANGQTIKIFVK